MSRLIFQIGVLIEDKELVDSWMGGNPRKAGKFALSLRLSLWSEHLGLRQGEVCEPSSIVNYFTFRLYSFNWTWRSVI